jgi:phage shock protein A
MQTTTTDTIDKDGKITRTITSVRSFTITKEQYVKELEAKQAQVVKLPIEISALQSKIAEVESKQRAEKIISVEENIV